MSITSSAVLVEMNISVWTAKIVDKSVTRTVTEDNAASTSAGVFHKNLMAGTSKRKEISDAAAALRSWHNARTLPWADKGARLLPTSAFLDYKAEANKRRDHLMGLVDSFLSEYDVHVARAQANLGLMFNVSDYPPVEEVRDKFGFRLVFSPVPEAGDFRLDVSAADLDEMKRDYDVAFNDRLADAMKEPWSKLHDMLVYMSEKLTDDESSETKKRYHDTFLTNAQDLCGLLTHLNLTKDPKLEEARQKLERAIGGLDMGDIKESAAARIDVKSRLDDVLSAYDW